MFQRNSQKQENKFEKNGNTTRFVRCMRLVTILLNVYTHKMRVEYGKLI